jgi:hypothetical protein
VVAHHEEEEDMYPLTTVKMVDAQLKDQELKVFFEKNAKMPQKDICFHVIEDTKVLCKNGKNYHSIISEAQGSQLIPLLPLTSWALASRRDDEIHDVLERYAYYHPEICQNLQILPSQ